MITEGRLNLNSSEGDEIDRFINSHWSSSYNAISQRTWCIFYFIFYVCCVLLKAVLQQVLYCFQSMCVVRLYERDVCERLPVKVTSRCHCCQNSTCLQIDR